MNLKMLLNVSVLAVVASLSTTANAGFNFSNPFDWGDNNNDSYRYDRGGPGNGYGRDRWRNYDEWEPNYWRYRYFDNNNRDNTFGNDFFGDGNGNGRFNFDMNMDTNSRFDGDYRNDFRNDYRGRSDGYRNDYGRPPARGGYDQAPARGGYDQGGRYGNDDQYNDDYWRNYSRRYGNSDQPAPNGPRFDRRR